MPSRIEKIKAIRLLVLDVDGVLTNGMIYYGEQAAELRGFNIKDGLGIKLLQKSGVSVAIISAKKSSAVAKRLQDLGIEHVYLGYENKLIAYNDLKKKWGEIDDTQIAYMGDDFPDLPILSLAGFSITVPDAPEPIKQAVDYISKNPGGAGAVREICELILKTQDNYTNVIKCYVSE